LILEFELEFFKQISPSSLRASFRNDEAKLNLNNTILNNDKNFIRIFGVKGMGARKLTESRENHLIVGLKKAGQFDAFPSKTFEFNGGMNMTAKGKMALTFFGMVGQ
jgi:hypothetical protein